MWEITITRFSAERLVKMKCLLSALDIISTSLEVLIRSIVIAVAASIAIRLPRRGSMTGALFLISLRGPDLIFMSLEETWIFGRILLSIYNADFWVLRRWIWRMWGLGWEIGVIGY